MRAMSPGDVNAKPSWLLVYCAWFTSLIATLGALFIGEVMAMEPCVLCWYQRIAMFPLVVILGLGLLPFDRRSAHYALPLAITGWSIALYHSLLYWNIVPRELAPCGQDVSCTDGELDLFGFVSIPLLSLMSFSLIVVLLGIAKGENSNE